MEDKQISIFDSVSQVSLSDQINQNEPSVWDIWIDGACRGNPGPSGAGIYIKKNKIFFAGYGFYLGQKTNNEAEYYALLIALFLVKNEMKSYDFIHITSDSQLLIKQMLGLYRVKKSELQDLFNVAKEESKDLHINFEHVLREHNKHADALANEGIDNKKSLPLKFLDMLHRYEVFI